MRLNITLFTLLLFFQGLSLTAQEKSGKFAYRMEQIKQANPWNSSNNSAGLIYNENEDFSTATLNYGYRKGKFAAVWDEKHHNRFNINTESFRNINRVWFYGRIDFDYVIRKEKTWSSVLSPIHTPIFLADTVPGKQTLELYSLSGGVGYDLNSRWALGGGIDYTTGSNAKNKDPRNKNTYMELSVRPGLIYRLNALRLGANFIYQRRTEKTEIKMFGSGHNQELFEFEGLWFYTSTVLSSSGNSEREFRDDIFGGALQVEYKGNHGQLLNEFTFRIGKQEIFRNKAGDDRGGEIDYRLYKYSGIANILKDDLALRMQLDADFGSRLSYENLQRKEVIDQTSHIVQYGRKNKGHRDNWGIGIQCALARLADSYRNNWEITLAARYRESEEQYRLHPTEFIQKIRYAEGSASFNKNHYRENHMWDWGITLSCGSGGGNALKTINSPDDEAAGAEDYKQRTELLLKEYDYLTATQGSGKLNIRYTRFLHKEKGMSLYGELTADYKQAVNGDNYKNKGRIDLGASVGLTF